jgi:hypothetical protein
MITNKELIRILKRFPANAKLKGVNGDDEYIWFVFIDTDNTEFSISVHYADPIAETADEK